MWNVPTHFRLDQVPRFYETDQFSIEDKLIFLHFFIGDCDWYVCEFNGEVFWGFAILNGDLRNAEWGYFSLAELQNIKVSNLIEVDCELESHWKIRPASQVDKICQALGWQLEVV